MPERACMKTCHFQTFVHLCLSMNVYLRLLMCFSIRLHFRFVKIDLQRRVISNDRNQKRHCGHNTSNKFLFFTLMIVTNLQVDVWVCIRVWEGHGCILPSIYNYNYIISIKKTKEHDDVWTGTFALNQNSCELCLKSVYSVKIVTPPHTHHYMDKHCVIRWDNFPYEI